MGPMSDNNGSTPGAKAQAGKRRRLTGAAAKAKRQPIPAWEPGAGDVSLNRKQRQRLLDEETRRNIAEFEARKKANGATLPTPPTAEPKTHSNGDSPYAAIPQELRDLEQWVMWRWDLRKGDKLTKVPYSPVTGYRASTTDSTTWGSFRQALALLAAGKYDGIGFVFAADDPYAGIDLDRCRLPETGVIAPWALEFIRALDGYVELSPSGTGVHIIVRGTVGPRGRQRVYETGKVEMYDHGRFFTMTGEQVVL